MNITPRVSKISKRSGVDEYFEIPGFVELIKPKAPENLIYQPALAAQVEQVKRLLGNNSRFPKILFFGAPGLGKTATLKNLAQCSSRPFWFVKLDRIYSSYLGGTASNVSSLFKAANKSNAVLVFDDIDGFLRKRDDPKESGESRRVVTSCLSALDNEGVNVAVLAATNLPNVIDPAAFRRFQFLLSFESLGRAENIILLKIFLGVEEPSERLIRAVEQLSPAEVVQVGKLLCQDDFCSEEFELQILQRAGALKKVRNL